LLVTGPHTGAGVDDQHGDPRIGQPRARLLTDRAGERVLVLEVHPAGVDQLELAPVPLAVELLAVARDPRALVHDRLARSRETVDQRGLAHVRIAEDCDLHRASMPARRRRPGQRGDAAPRASAATRATTSSTVKPVVSSTTAPGAARNGLCSRAASRSSRSACSASTTAGSASSSAARLRARSFALAVRKTLSAASGATTVPMSRPS